MEVKELRCTICTSPHLEKVSEYEYRCSNCGAIVKKEKAENFEEVFKRLQEEGQTLDISNLRYLVKRSLENHIDRDSLIKYSQKILRILPDDVLSLFYLKYINKNKYPLDYESFLDSLNNQATITEMNEIIDIIVSSTTNRDKDKVLKLSNHFYGNKYNTKINDSLEQRKREIDLFSDVPRDVFICWSSIDKEEANKVLNALEEDGNTCWISNRNMPWDTDNYWDNITKAIKSCDIFLCLSSENSIKSQDCIKEVEIASKLNKNKRIEYKIDNYKDSTLFKRFFTGQWITNIDDLLEKVYDTKHKEEDLYKNAIELLYQDEYIKAKQIFTNIENYEKSNIYIKICDGCINAIMLYDDGLYTQAKERLSLLKSYNYAIDVINKLIDKYEKIILESEISKAQTYISLGLYDEAINLYRNLLINNKESFKIWYGYLEAITYNFTDNTNPSIKNVYENALRLVSNKIEKENLEQKYNKLFTKESSNEIDTKTNNNVEVIEKPEEKKVIKVTTANEYLDYLKKGYKDEDLELEDAKEMNNLGDCYYNGEGTDQDYKKAFEWFKKGAEEGNASAMSNLGCCYYKGKGTDKNYSNAFEWYKKAAEQGNADAMNRLGDCYKSGEGTDKDESKALKWYKKGAEQGNAYAMISLGSCYHFGEGTDKDESKAFEWYKKAAEQGNAYAMSILGLLYDCGECTNQDKSKAFEWYKKGAEQGNANAMTKLTFCYYNGKGTDQDYKKAFEWCKKGAEQGNADAMMVLGLLYYYGEATDQDKSKAFEWFKKAAKLGNANAISNLKDLYPYDINN